MQSSALCYGFSSPIIYPRQPESIVCMFKFDFVIPSLLWSCVLDVCVTGIWKLSAWFLALKKHQLVWGKV